VFAAPINESEALSDICGTRIEALCGVANAGDDTFLTGHPLAAANLYAFGRLGTDPKLPAREIITDWVREEFGKDIPALADMMLESAATYEKYTSPLGLGWLVQPGYHYGPSPSGYEFSQWGTYHKANHTHIGVERGMSGTGYVSQYHPHLAALYDDPATTPEELLLFFHRAPFDYRLRSGKTLIQHIYDTHFEGAEDVERFIETWRGLADDVPADVHAEVTRRLERQLHNAREWRDVVNTYFCRLTAVADELGRRIYE
jgi:alpha-glucuronidase